MVVLCYLSSVIKMRVESKTVGKSGVTSTCRLYLYQKNPQPYLGKINQQL